MNFKYCNLLEDSDLLNVANDDSEEILTKKELFESDEYKSLYEYVHNHYLMKMTELD